MTELTPLPAGWKWVKLGDACEIIFGQSPPSETYNDNGIGLPFFQGKSEFTELHPIVKKWCNKPKKIAKVNDILLSVRAPVGSTNIANQECCIGRGLAAIRFNNSKFIFYYLRSIEQLLDKKGTGTTFRAITSENVKNVDFPLPPLPLQQAIVSKIEELFSELDKGIEYLKTAQLQLKTYRHSVLKWAFEGKLSLNFDLSDSADGHDVPLAAEPVGSYSSNSSDSELYPLSKGWKWVRLGEVANEIGDGLHGTPLFTNSGDYYFINGNNLNDGIIEIKYDTKKVPLSEYNKYKKNLGNNSILISINGTIGKIAFYNGEKVILGKSACYINIKSDYNILYLKYYLQSISFFKYTNKNSTGSTIKNVGLKVMREFPIPIPRLKIQEQIVQEIESRLSVADKMEETINQSLQQAEVLRQSILKRAFEGKLSEL